MQTISSFLRTDADGFLFADRNRVNFGDKLLDGNVWVLVHVRVNVGLQRLELVCGETDGNKSQSVTVACEYLAFVGDTWRLSSPVEK